MAKSKHPVEIKLLAVEALHEGKLTVKEICERYDMTAETLHYWKIKYQLHGVEGLNVSTTWNPYSKELKLAAIEDYMVQRLTLMEVLTKYGISHHSVLYRWIKKYTSHSRLKDTGKGRNPTMTNGRKTTFKERVFIVNECLQNEKDYQQTAKSHGVSYQQVYQWVKKFEASGEEALRDGRGRKKDEAELSSEDKLKLEIQRMARENERLRAENLFLKKLEELERRHR